MLQIWKGFTDSNCMNDFDNRFKGLKSSVALELARETLCYYCIKLHYYYIKLKHQKKYCFVVCVVFSYYTSIILNRSLHYDNYCKTSKRTTLKTLTIRKRRCRRNNI